MRANSRKKKGLFSCAPWISPNLCSDTCSSRALDDSKINGDLMSVQKPLDLKIDNPQDPLVLPARPLDFSVPNEETDISMPPVYSNDFQCDKKVFSEITGFSPKRHLGRSATTLDKIGIPAMSVPITPSASSFATATRQIPPPPDLMSLHEQFGKHLQRCVGMLRQKDNMEVALRGATEIRQVLTAPGEPPIQQVLNCDVVPSLLSCLSLSDAPSLQMQAAVTLRVLCSGTPTQISSILAAPGVVPGLVSAIHSAVNKVRQEALIALSRLAHLDVAARDAVFANGGVGPICAQALLQKVPGTQRLATMALACVLSGSPPPVHPSIEKSALTTLVHLLRSTEDDEVLSNVLLGLHYVSKGGPKVAATECVVADSAGVRRLLKCLEDEDAKKDLMSTALGIVGSISTSTKQHVHVLLTHGLLDHLCKLIQSQNAVIRKCTCTILSNVLTEHQVAQPHTGRLFNSLANILRSDDDTVQREALWAVFNAAEYGHAPQVTELVNAGFIPILLRKITNADTEVVGQAVQTLLRIVEIGAVASVENSDFDTLAPMPKNPFVTQVEENEGIQTLLTLRRRSNLPETVQKNLGDVLALCGHSTATVLNVSDDNVGSNTRSATSNVMLGERSSTRGTFLRKDSANGLNSKKTLQDYSTILGRIEKHRSKTYTPNNNGTPLTEEDKGSRKPDAKHCNNNKDKIHKRSYSFDSHNLQAESAFSALVQRTSSLGIPLQRESTGLELAHIGTAKPKLQQPIEAWTHEPQKTLLSPHFVEEPIRGLSPGRSTVGGSTWSVSNEAPFDRLVSAMSLETKGQCTLDNPFGSPKMTGRADSVKKFDCFMSLEQELLSAECAGDD